jgi:hypothetical protein
MTQVIHGGASMLRNYSRSIFKQPTLHRMYRCNEGGQLIPAGDKHEVQWEAPDGSPHCSSQVVSSGFNCESLGDTLVRQGESAERVILEYPELHWDQLTFELSDKGSHGSLYYRLGGNAIDEFDNGHTALLKVQSGISGGQNAGTDSSLLDFMDICSNLQMGFTTAARTVRTRRSGQNFSDLAVERVSQMGVMIKSIIANRRAMAEWRTIAVSDSEVRELLSDCYKAATRRKVSDELGEGKLDRLVQVYKEEDGADPGSLFGVYQGISWMLARSNNGGVLDNPNNRMLKPLSERDAGAHTRAAKVCQRWAATPRTSTISLS